jgi:hypothetical protein
MPTQRKTQNEGRTAFLHVRIEPEVLDRFRAIAEAEHRTVSQEVRHYIDRRLAEASSPVSELGRAA